MDCSKKGLDWFKKIGLDFWILPTSEHRHDHRPCLGPGLLAHARARRTPGPWARDFCFGWARGRDGRTNRRTRTERAAVRPMEYGWEDAEFLSNVAE